MARQISEEEVEEYILASQHRRHDERVASPEWVMVDDEWTELLGGGAWRRIDDEQ